VSMPTRVARGTKQLFLKSGKAAFPGSGGGLGAGHWAQALGGASRYVGLLSCSSETRRFVPNAQATTADSDSCGSVTACQRFIGVLLIESMSAEGG